MNNLLPLLIIIPLAAGIIVSVWGQKLGSAAVKLAVVSLLASLVLSVVALVGLNQTPESTTLIGTIHPKLIYQYFSFEFPFRIKDQPVHWQLAFGLDGVGALMVLLTTIVSACMGIAACKQITTRLHVYLGLILITQSILLGVFLAMDLLTFYMFFEAVLLPVILMIYLWGDPETSAKAARRFLLFTLAGSIPMVVGLIGLIFYATPQGESSIILLPEVSAAISAIDKTAATVTEGVTNTLQLEWVLYVLLFGFGIKMAIVPLHSWLPTTYESAHPNTTALIAAVVGKLGIFGILRIVLPMMPNTMAQSAQWLFAGAGSIAIVYGALCALAQTDIRRLFAYSSISHLGFITVGLMSFKQFGIQGAILQMFNHGIIIAAVFLMIAALEMRYGREKMLEQYHGFASKTPALACFFIFFLLAGAGLPGLNSFVGEFMTVGAMMQVSIPVACFSALGILFGAWYSLRFIQYLFFGPTNERHEKRILHSAVDLYPAEKIALVPLMVICVVIGVMPMLAIGIYQNDVLGMIDNLPSSTNVAVASLDSSVVSQR